MRFKIYILLSFLMALLASCKDTIVTTTEVPEEEELPVSNDSLVLISSGGESMTQTRATVNYMPNGIRFSAMMLHRINKFYDYSYNLTQHAYMLVDNNGAGNSWYYKNSYVAPTEADQDSYHNDKNSSIFYWVNRLEHCFIGYIDDYNKALSWAKNPSVEPYVPQSIEMITDWSQLDLIEQDNKTASDEAKEMKKKFVVTRKSATDDDSSVTPYRWQQYYLINLSNCKIDEKGDTIKDSDKKPVRLYGSMEAMPDPLIAFAEKVPEGSDAEKNRVYLTFKHQLAQVQVNVKGSEMGGDDITTDAIKKIELLGVSTEARVFPFPEFGYNNWNYDREIEDPEIIYHGSAKTLLRPAEAVGVDLSKYSYEHLDDNRWGSSYEMYEIEEARTPYGYKKSFESVAFGTLQAIRLYWEENWTGNPTADQDKEHIQHVVTFVVTDTGSTNMKNLQSGKRYIFNLELRRGTLAVVKAEVEDWLPYEYKDEKGDYIYEHGTIIN